MKQKMDQLKEKLAELMDLRSASAVLGWDQLVNMPVGGAEDRGEQIATIEKISHAKSTSDELGKLLEDLAGYAYHVFLLEIFSFDHADEEGMEEG